MPPRTDRFVFPRLANYALPLLVVAIAGGALYVPVLLGFGVGPSVLDVGYQPEQPVPYSHALHAGQLGIDCRYCHTAVDKADHANIPPTQTCMNCHTNIRTESKALQPVRDSWATNQPIEWVRVHDLPDYAYFNHSAHINKGVGCVSCHGRIDQMEVVYQAKKLSMGWCLECHREPEKFLRPKDQVTNMSYVPEGGEQNQVSVGLRLKAEYGIRDQAYMTSCSTCHR
jgi:menaquinone reductase, multiheme cytochrome c subunit